MVRFILPHAIRFYHEFFGVADAAGADARWIAGHILAHHLDKITAREIARAYHLDPEKDAYRLSQAMNLLERSRWVGPREDNPIKRSTLWRVNSQVHALFAARAAKEATRRAEIVKGITAAETRLQQAGFA
jgi:hypothetical protein